MRKDFHSFPSLLGIPPIQLMFWNANLRYAPNSANPSMGLCGCDSASGLILICWSLRAEKNTIIPQRECSICASSV